MTIVIKDGVKMKVKEGIQLDAFLNNGYEIFTEEKTVVETVKEESPVEKRKGGRPRKGE